MGCRKVVKKKDYNSYKRAFNKKVQTLSNRDRWRRRLNEREGEVDDFFTCKGQEKVAREEKQKAVRELEKLLIDEVGLCP